MRKHSLKILTSIVVSIILFTGFALIGTNASSTQLAPAGAGEQTIIVVGGDTLWSIASNYIEEGDIRRTVYSIKKRNNLDSTVLQPGQTLIIP
ncbi:LysM peptidoglycan-binding domain-containing protein [Paenibacillus sp. GCM10023252]